MPDGCLSSCPDWPLNHMKSTEICVDHLVYVMLAHNKLVKELRLLLANNNNNNSNNNNSNKMIKMFKFKRIKS